MAGRIAHDWLYLPQLFYAIQHSGGVGLRTGAHLPIRRVTDADKRLIGRAGRCARDIGDFADRALIGVRDDRHHAGRQAGKRHGGSFCVRFCCLNAAALEYLCDFLLRFAGAFGQCLLDFIQVPAGLFQHPRLPFIRAGQQLFFAAAEADHEALDHVAGDPFCQVVQQRQQGFADLLELFRGDHSVSGNSPGFAVLASA